MKMWQRSRHNEAVVYSTRKAGVEVYRDKSKTKKTNSLKMTMCSLILVALVSKMWRRAFPIKQRVSGIGIRGGGDISNSKHDPSASMSLPTCKSIDIEAASISLVCLPKCKPSFKHTIQGLGLDPHEKIDMTVKWKKDHVTAEYGRYRVHFPEENISLDVTEIKPAQVDIRPRTITERLFRRIIAKLFRAGVMDPGGDIINTGSWIGDNAVPWAKMLEQLKPEEPGRVIAVDPSPKFVQQMANLANDNGVGNLCTRIGVFSSEEKSVFANNAEHATLGDSGKMEFNAFPLWSLHLSHVSLVHLDVEGHESEVLKGALPLLASSRPVVITETDGGPSNKNDKEVLSVMNSMGYWQFNDIPEICGFNVNSRNRIWWPDVKTQAAAMVVIGKDLEQPIVPWVATELPERV